MSGRDGDECCEHPGLMSRWTDKKKPITSHLGSSMSCVKRTRSCWNGESVFVVMFSPQSWELSLSYANVFEPQHVSSSTSWRFVHPTVKGSKNQKPVASFLLPRHMKRPSDKVSHSPNEVRQMRTPLVFWLKLIILCRTSVFVSSFLILFVPPRWVGWAVILPLCRTDTLQYVLTSSHSCDQSVQTRIINQYIKNCLSHPSDTP